MLFNEFDTIAKAMTPGTIWAKTFRMENRAGGVICRIAQPYFHFNASMLAETVAFLWSFFQLLDGAVCDSLY